MEFKREKGYLVHWPLAEGQITQAMLLSSASIEYKGTIENTKWEIYYLKSPVPLLPAEEEAETRQEYRYRISCRRSGRRLVLAAVHRKIVDVLLESYLTNAFHPKLRKVNILVHEFVKSMTFNNSTDIRTRRFQFTSIHARTTIYGPTLRSLSLYGDDIGLSELFRREFESIACYSCGLGLSGGTNEIIRIGNDGSLSFSIKDSLHAQAIEDALGLITESKFIHEGKTA